MNRTRTNNSVDMGMPAPFAQRLAALISVEDERKIVRTLREALDATTIARAPRAADGANNYFEAIDWGARIAAAKILWEMRDGRPRQAIDMSVQAVGRPMTRIEAARELMENWDEIRRIGDEHVRLLKLAMPEIVDVEAAEP